MAHLIGVHGSGSSSSWQAPHLLRQRDKALAAVQGCFALAALPPSHQNDAIAAIALAEVWGLQSLASFLERLLMVTTLQRCAQRL